MLLAEIAIPWRRQFTIRKRKNSMRSYVAQVGAGTFTCCVLQHLSENLEAQQRFAREARTLNDSNSCTHTTSAT